VVSISRASGNGPMRTGAMTAVWTAAILDLVMCPKGLTMAM